MKKEEKKGEKTREAEGRWKEKDAKWVNRRGEGERRKREREREEESSPGNLFQFNTRLHGIK